MTDRGDRPRRGGALSNYWARLLKRVQKNQPDFAALHSFKILRKTAGQLVLEASDGETARVFLSHGKPVPSDPLLGAYTRPVFEKVFAANRKVRDRLAPMFAAAPDAFAKVRSGRSPNLSATKIDEIQALWQSGRKPEEIARITGVGRTTVYRYRPTVAA